MSAEERVHYRQRKLPFMEEFMTEQFRDLSADLFTEATIDREQHLVRNVALLGPASRNGYRYTAEAMQQAVPLYEGRPVFVDHGDAVTGEPNLTNPTAPLRRSIRDYAGKIVQARFENERIRGDLRLAGPNRGWLLELIESSPSDIGMSHVVLARRSPAGQEVERIERVVSVDIVAFPATTQTFLEASVVPLANARGSAATQSQSPERERIQSPERERIQSPERERRVSASLADARGSAATQSQGPERERRVSASLADARGSAAMATLLEHSRLPAGVRTEMLQALLRHCWELGGPAAAAQLLELLENYWGEVQIDPPRSFEKTSPKHDGQQLPPLAARRALVAAIRGN